MIQKKSLSLKTNWMVQDIGEPEKMETILGRQSCGLLFVGIAREWEKKGKRAPPPERGAVEN